jgi:hypothetical protein
MFFGNAHIEKAPFWLLLVIIARKEPLSTFHTQNYLQSLEPLFNLTGPTPTIDIEPKFAGQIAPPCEKLYRFLSLRSSLNN